MARIPGATLNVTQTTSLQDVQAFADQAGTGKIRGKHNPDGSITLFAKDNDSSLWSQLTGKTDKRRQAAHSAIQMVMQSAKQAQGVQDGSAAALLLDQATEMACRRNPRGVALGQLAQFAATFQPPAPAPAASSVPAQLASARENVQALANNLLGAATMQHQIEVVEDMFAALGPALAPLNDRDKLALAMSDVGAALREMVGVDFEALPEAQRQRAETVLAAVADRVQDGCLNSHARVDGSFTLHGDHFTMERKLGAGSFGVAYLCVANAGMADEKQVVLKLPKGYGEHQPGSEAYLENIAEQRDEFLAHAGLQTNISSNDFVLGLEGGVRMPDGSIGVLSEVAGCGTANSMTMALSELVEEGLISPELNWAMAKTMAKDMFTGLAEMADAGFYHGDIAYRNVFLASDGSAKVADFGASTTQGSRSSLDDFVGQDSREVAPEVLNGLRTTHQLETLSTRIENAGREEGRQSLAAAGGLFFPKGLPEGMTLEQAINTLSPADRKALNAISATIELPDDSTAVSGNFNAREAFNRLTGQQANAGDQIVAAARDVLSNREAMATQIDLKKADVYQAGIAALSGFMGRDPFTAHENGVAGAVVVETHLLDTYATNPENTALGENGSMFPVALEDGSIVGRGLNVVKSSTGEVDHEMNALLNQMLKPRPEDRISMREAAQHEALQMNEGVYEMTHELIAAVADFAASRKDPVVAQEKKEHIANLVRTFG